ncbi:hypothetical protein CRUP_015798 [Coryphaenoides rupestris]|nr:hypothetical protein CRUP_015798 [Coryphaenoides rupestris]
MALPGGVVAITWLNFGTRHTCSGQVVSERLTSSRDSPPAAPAWGRPSPRGTPHGTWSSRPDSRGAAATASLVALQGWNNNTDTRLSSCAAAAAATLVPVSKCMKYPEPSVLGPPKTSITWTHWGAVDPCTMPQMFSRSKSHESRKLYRRLSFSRSLSLNSMRWPMTSLKAGMLLTMQQQQQRSVAVVERMGPSLEDTDPSFVSNIPVAVDLTVAVVYSVFGVCSLVGNSTLLYVSYKKKHLLKPAEYFIVNLAVSDLGLTLSLYPMAITSSFYHRWLYGWSVCYLYAFCGMLFGICSLTTLTLLSVVCFVKVCYPLYGNRFSPRHGRVLVVCAWAYALLFASAPLARWGEYGPEPYGTACCINWRLSNRRATARSYTAALFLCCYILPCCAIAASYAAILVRLRASRRTTVWGVFLQVDKSLWMTSTVMRPSSAWQSLPTVQPRLPSFMRQRSSIWWTFSCSPSRL